MRLAASGSAVPRRLPFLGAPETDGSGPKVERTGDPKRIGCRGSVAGSSLHWLQTACCSSDCSRLGMAQDLVLQLQPRGPQLGRGSMPLSWLGCAGLQDDVVELEYLHAVSPFDECRGKRRIVMGAFPHGGHVNDFPEAIHVCRRNSLPPGCDVTVGAEAGRFPTGGSNVGHQPDVREFGEAIHVDDIGRFYVPVDEALFMEKLERFGE